MLQKTIQCRLRVARWPQILGLALLVALSLGCEALSPALKYEQAARQLRFTLDRVEPRI